MNTQDAHNAERTESDRGQSATSTTNRFGGIEFDPDTFEPLPVSTEPLADLTPARELLAAGFKLCALHQNSKRPVGDG